MLTFPLNLKNLVLFFLLLQSIWKPIIEQKIILKEMEHDFQEGIIEIAKNKL